MTIVWNIKKLNLTILHEYYVRLAVKGRDEADERAIIEFEKEYRTILLASSWKGVRWMRIKDWDWCCKGIILGDKSSSWQIWLIFTVLSVDKTEGTFRPQRIFSQKLPSHDIKEWYQTPASPLLDISYQNATNRVDNKSEGERIGTCSTGFANRYCSVVLAFGSALCCLCVVRVLAWLWFRCGFLDRFEVRYPIDLASGLGKGDLQQSLGTGLFFSLLCRVEWFVM